MEECEALCRRIGIMVGGRLKCIGSANHLKKRFGNGLQVDLRTMDDKAEQVKARLVQLFPGSFIVEEHGGSIKLRIPAPANPADLKFSFVFEQIESHKAELFIDEYSVSETTLEQIFIGFASKQAEETGKALSFDGVAPPLIGCDEYCGTVCAAMCCPCFVFGSIYSKASPMNSCGKLCCIYCMLMPLYGLQHMYHSSLRREFMKNSKLDDYNAPCNDSAIASCCCVCFCTSCTLAQAQKIVEVNG